MKCSVCNKQCRTTSIVHVKKGVTLERKRACPKCEGEAIKVLCQEPSARCKCGEPATVCHVCAGEKERRGKKEGADVAAIVKRLRAMAVGCGSGDEADYTGGRRSGIETAIELLESGRW